MGDLIENYGRVIDRLEAYASAYAGLRAAVQLYLDGSADKEFLAAWAEKMDAKVPEVGGSR